MANETQGLQATGFRNKTPCFRGVLSALRRYVLQVSGRRQRAERSKQTDLIEIPAVKTYASRLIETSCGISAIVVMPAKLLSSFASRIRSRRDMGSNR